MEHLLQPRNLGWARFRLSLSRSLSLSHSLVLALALVLSCLSLASCTSYLELGDAAYERNNWEVAIINYQRAMRASSDPDELQHLKARLEECQTRAGAEHFAAAQDLVGIGDYPKALAHAERAFRYTPTPEVQALLRDLRSRESARLLALGKAALESQQWDQAVRRFQRAQELLPTEEGAALLVRAVAERQKYHAAEFLRLEDEALEELHQRNWSAAAELYRAAHHHGKSEQSVLQHRFATRMAEAERLLAEGPCDSHRAELVARVYEEALGCGYDTAYVQARLEMVEPREYMITIHSAVILPFKPGSQQPWDGIAVRRVRGADELLRGLGTFAAPGVEIALLGGRAFQRMSSTREAPDCYPIVKLGEQVYGGPDCAREDDLRPTWNLQFRVIANGLDPRVLGLQVLDRDLKSSDRVGSWKVPLTELIMDPGTRVIRLFDERGRLQADGLLAVKVTTTRL